MRGQELEKSDRERDFDIHIQENLDWEIEARKTVTQANRNLGIVWRIYENNTKNRSHTVI